MALTPERVEERLRAAFPGASITRQEGPAVRDYTLHVPGERIVEICTFLRDLGWGGIVAILSFFVVLGAGYIYARQRGALDWR